MGVDSVVASDIKTSSRGFLESGPFVYADVQDYDSLARIVLEHGIDYIIHLASLLSAIGEKNPQLALKINTAGIQNVLELARLFRLRVYAPSTIAVFGPTSPKDLTPDVTVMEPTTMYGITKVHLELLGRYYNRVYDVDFRSIRYPGVISGNTKPGGGTTDYAVEIYHEALKHGSYHCFLATVGLMMAPREKLTQNIAMTWPRTIDDSRARQDWGWQPDYDIQRMTEEMLGHLGKAYNAPSPQLASR
eukprot:jgi/Mesen1/7075/ME000369S06398